jgi:hypothetical protein
LAEIQTYSSSEKFSVVLPLPAGAFVVVDSRVSQPEKVAAVRAPVAAVIFKAALRENFFPICPLEVISSFAGQRQLPV